MTKFNRMLVKKIDEERFVISIYSKEKMNHTAKSYELLWIFLNAAGISFDNKIISTIYNGKILLLSKTPDKKYYWSYINETSKSHSIDNVEIWDNVEDVIKVSLHDIEFFNIFEESIGFLNWSKRITDDLSRKS